MLQAVVVSSRISLPKRCLKYFAASQELSGREKDLFARPNDGNEGQDGTC